MKYTNESGRSMVEMLGVLAIIGVLSVGGIAGYSKAMNKYKINKTNDQVSMLVANIRTLFSGQGNYAGLNNGAAIKFGVVPNDMYTTADTYASDYAITNAFAGDVTIDAVAARSTTGAPSDEAFVIAYDGLTEEACVAMLTGDWGSGQASGLIAIAGGGAEGGKTAADAKTEVNKIFTDSQTAATATNAVAAGLIIAAPGAAAASLKVPVTVANAVTACDGGNSGNAVAWKYY